MSKTTRAKRGSIGANAAVLTVSKFCTYAILLVNSMLLSRFRTLTEYGTLSQMLLVVSLVTSFIMIGLPSSMNYFMARAETREERNKFISIYYSLNTLLSFVAGLVLLLSIPLMEVYFNNPNIGKYFIFLALYPWTSIITSSVENLLIVHNKAGKLFIYRISHSVCTVMCVLFVYLTKLSFTVYVYSYLAVEVFFCLLTYFIAIRLDGLPKWSLDGSYIKSILAFSVPLGLSTAAGTIKAEMDKFVIGLFFSTEEYAIYANAAKELPFNMISSSITAVLLPVIARKIKDNLIDESVALWKEATSISYMINAFFAFGLFAFSREAMTFLYSEKYESGYVVFALYSLVILFRSAYFGMILQTTGKTKAILKSSILSMVINLVLNFVLYYALGFIGPAVATIIATAFSATYLLINTKKETGIPVRKLFPWGDIAIITLVNVALGVVFVAIKHFAPLERYIGTVGEAFALAFAWLVVYVLILSPKIKEKMKLLKNKKVGA